MQNCYLRNQKNEEEQQNSERAGQRTPHCGKRSTWLLAHCGYGQLQAGQKGQVRKEARCSFSIMRGRVLIKNGYRQVESLWVGVKRLRKQREQEENAPAKEAGTGTPGGVQGCCWAV